MPLISLGIGVAQTAISHAAASDQAKAQTQVYENNRLEALRAQANSYAGIQNKALQERASASQELQNVQLEGLKARSSAAVLAGEAGVTGVSVDALMGDFYAQQGRYERTLDQNYRMNADFLRSEMDATQSQTNSRINSVQPGQKPGFAGAAIRVLGSAVGAYGEYQQAKALETAKQGASSSPSRVSSTSRVRIS